jgi:hypothetical protein
MCRCLEKEAEVGLGERSFQPRCEGMGTSVSSRLSPSCRFLLARLQINASRTQCALHPILPTSFASTASSLSCPRIILPTPENRNVRSARNRSGNREPTKSPTSTSALPGHHVEANLVPRWPPARHQATRRIRCRCAHLLALIRGSNRTRILVFHQAQFQTIRRPPLMKPLQLRLLGMPRQFRQPNPQLPTPPRQTGTSLPLFSYPLYPALRISLWSPGHFPILPSYPSRFDTVHRLSVTRTPTMETWKLSLLARQHRRQPHRSRIAPDTLTRGETQLGFRTAPASGEPVRPSPSQLTLTPHLNGTSQDGGDDQSVSSPSTDSQAGDFWLDHGTRLLLLSHPNGVSIFFRVFSSQKITTLHLRPPLPHMQLLLNSRFRCITSSTTQEALVSLIEKVTLHASCLDTRERREASTLSPERPPESLETWDMLSDVELRVSPCSSFQNSFQVRPAHRNPGCVFSSQIPAAEGARSKHRSLSSNHRVLPPPLPLASTAQRHPANSSTDVDPREPASTQRQSPIPGASATSSAPAVLIPSSPSERLPIQSMQALLKPPAVIEDPTRGRTLRATSSMVWASGRRNSPLPSPTRTVTAPTSPSTASVQSSIASANFDHDADSPAITIVRDDQESIHGTVPPSPVQEEEEEHFVTPPGSPIRGLAALPLATRSRHPSPVRHEGRSGVTLRDDGPVPLGSPTRSDPHSRAAHAPTITPRPSVGALHAFAPSNPSPLSNQSFERQAAIPTPSTTALSTIENIAAPRRDTVVSIGDTESLIELYVHSSGPATAIPTTGSVMHATTAATTSEAGQRAPANGADPKQYHYPGRPLPHPPGASQSGPVRPVLLNMFLAGNVPAGLPPYTEVEPGKQQSASALSSQSQPKKVPCAICLPPSPLVGRPEGGYIPPPIPPPGLLAMLDDDVVSEPSSPGSTYEMSFSPPVPPAMQREFTSFEALETRRDDYMGDGDGSMAVTTTGSNREARHLPSALAPYCVADPRTSITTEHASGTQYQEPRTPGFYDEGDGDGDWDGDGDDAFGGHAIQRERDPTGPCPGGATAGHAQRACEAQVGSAWHDRGSVRDVQDAVPGQ